MAELRPQDRLLPSLLDRLTDDEPDNKHVEPPERRVLTIAGLKKSVLEDLRSLFNTTQLVATGEMEEFPLVTNSVVNFGLPAFSGMTASSVELRTMEIALRQAILDFEPRLLPDSVRVRARRVESPENHHNKISFDIECKLWAQPAPLALLLYSDVDLESGQNSVEESGRR